MTALEIYASVASSFSLVGFIWNRLGIRKHIKKLEIEVNGLQIKWMDAEKKMSFAEGVKMEKDHPE